MTRQVTTYEKRNSSPALSKFTKKTVAIPVTVPKITDNPSGRQDKDVMQVNDGHPPAMCVKITGKNWERPTPTHSRMNMSEKM